MTLEVVHGFVVRQTVLPTSETLSFVMLFWTYVSGALVTFWVNDENAKQRRHADGVQPGVADTATSLATTRMEATNFVAGLRRHAERPTGSCTFRRCEGVAKSPEFAGVREA